MWKNFWSVGGGYRHVYELSKGKFKIENEPYIAATLSLKRGGLTLESRNLLYVSYCKKFRKGLG